MAESYISELGDSLSHGVANTNGDRVKIIAPKLYNDGNGNHPSIATALSGKVSKSGDTMTGQLVNTMTGEAIKVSHGTGNKDAFVSAERTDQSVKVSFGVGAGGVNHGLYSNKNSNWIIKADTSANVTINDGKAGTTIYLGSTNVGDTNKPMYLASGKISEGSLYAGGTAVTLNGTSKGASTASFYAPTAVGTSGQVLTSSGSGAPAWTNQSSLGVGAADHLNAYGYTLLWESGAYVVSKPYALLAEKTVSTAGNWGFGNLFKIECGNNYAIFKVTMVGSRSAVSTSPSPTIHIIESYGISVSNYSKLIVARYTFTANGTCNVKIYTDWSLTAASWMRVTLRQLDNQSGDQSAYNNWDKWTFYKQTGNSEMLASVSGTEFAIDYASARFGGTATAATKLSTARKTYVTLGTASTSTTRDWSGDTTIPVDGTLAVSHGGTGMTTVTNVNSVVIGNSSSATGAMQTVAAANGAFYSTGANVKPQFGTLPAAQGGTGKTSAKDACNAFINALDTGSSTPVDADYYVSQYVSGGTTTTTYHRRPMSALWTYIKGKLTSVSGVNISGNAATATSASSASKVANKLTLNIKTGTTEGTDLYTYDGSGAKTLDIKQGSNITLTAAAGSLTIAGTADTKNTAGSTDTSSKIFLIGATSQAANPQTYSQDTTYVDTDATLASTKVRVAEKCTLQFNTTTNALDFVFA